MLLPAVEDANAELEKIGIAPIGRIGFHALRRTYASLRMNKQACALTLDQSYALHEIS